MVGESVIFAIDFGLERWTFSLGTSFHHRTESSSSNSLPHTSPPWLVVVRRFFDTRWRSSLHRSWPSSRYPLVKWRNTKENSLSRFPTPITLDSTTVSTVPNRRTSPWNDGSSTVNIPFNARADTIWWRLGWIVSSSNTNRSSTMIGVDKWISRNTPKTTNQPRWSTSRRWFDVHQRKHHCSTVRYPREVSRQQRLFSTSKPSGKVSLTTAWMDEKSILNQSNDLLSSTDSFLAPCTTTETFL